MHSAIYCGWLRHRRGAPRAHAFRFPLFMVYLDLAELDSVFAGRWLWSTTRAALARFDRRDHLGDPAVPLERAVRDVVAERTGWRPDGPIRLLTHLRYFGFVFNPVSFYYCFDAADTRVQAVVAEVHNIPWRERHVYVLAQPLPDASALWWRYRSAKAMHVSPFNPMELEYRWGFGPPGPRLAVHMALEPLREPAPGADDAGRLFDATLSLARSPINALTLMGVLLRFPLMTLQVVGAIHWQALRLWLKRVPVYTHPAKRAAAAIPSDSTTTP
jgi:uncharacterized protein